MFIVQVSVGHFFITILFNKIFQKNFVVLLTKYGHRIYAFGRARPYVIMELSDQCVSVNIVI